jgi:hypothetical protein
VLLYSVLSTILPIQQTAADKKSMLLVSLQQGEVTAEVDLTHEGSSEKGGD